MIDLSSLFKKAKKIEETTTHEYDKSRNSIVTSTWFYPKSGGYVHIACIDWGTEMYEKHNWTDELNISIGTEEFKLFLQNDPY